MSALRKKGVDGGPSPAMTEWAWSVLRLMQLSLGVASVFALLGNTKSILIVAGLAGTIYTIHQLFAPA
jgi:hypothetical protein